MLNGTNSDFIPLRDPAAALPIIDVALGSVNKIPVRRLLDGPKVKFVPNRRIA
jgi:hypothetical protein